MRERQRGKTLNSNHTMHACCRLALSACSAHQSAQCIYCLTLLPADKKTSLKTSNHILHTNYSITWRGAEDMGEMEVVVVVVMGAA